MKEEARKEIIKMLVKWAEEIGGEEEIREENEELDKKKKFWGKNKELGKTNIRTTATAILQASCYDEVKLFLEYKGARKNTGWDKLFDDKNTFAEYIIKKLDELRKKVNKKYEEDPTFDKEKEVIELAARFLGYIYWKIYGLVNQRESGGTQSKNNKQDSQIKNTNPQLKENARPIKK